MLDEMDNRSEGGGFFLSRYSLIRGHHDSFE